MHWYGAYLGHLWLFLCVIAANERHFMIKTGRESWISIKKFTAIIEMSFNATRCCSVFTSGKSAVVDNLLEEFIRFYPYGYTLNNTNNDCNCYLIISASVDGVAATMRNFPTTSKSKLLVIVDSDVKESTWLFNVSIYGNANVNIASPNGLWSLSDVLLAPRIFREIVSLDEMSRKRRILNMQGRRLIAGAFFNPPFSYLQSSINRTVEGIDEEYFIADDSELDGVEVKLFKLLAAQLNFTWLIRKPKNNIRYGQRNGTGWSGGIIGLFHEGKTDIAFTNLWLTPEHNEFTKMTIPWTAISRHFLVPRPKPYTSFWGLARPLSPGVWTAIVTMLVAKSVYVYSSARISDGIPTRFRSFAITWTELAGRLLGACTCDKVQGLRVQFLLWHFIGVLLVTAYSSSLAANLTNTHYEKRIDTLRDFFEANLTWGTQEGLSHFNYVFDKSNPYARQLFENYEFETDETARHRKILRGNYAIIGNVISGIYFPKEVVRDDDLKDLRVMKESTGTFFAALAVQDWLYDAVDTVLLRMFEAGLVKYCISDVLHRRTGHALREVLVEHDGPHNSAKVLELTPLAAGFAVLFVGLSMSMIVLCHELWSKRKLNWHDGGCKNSYKMKPNKNRNNPSIF